MSTPHAARLAHRLSRMTGRDPNETHRAATPLELLFDLTFVVAFSQAGTQTAHLLAEGHVAPAVIGFALAMFAVCWAWINYSWLASAYDTDDVFFRVATMVQMLGVLVLAVGMPQFFHSIDEGVHLDNSVVVAGYVIMRLSTIALWVRAARHDPTHRSATLTYVTVVGIAQVGWIVVIFIDPPLAVAVALFVVLGLFEILGPVIAERFRGGTPWHAHHIAERYSLLVIITLGEVVLGTTLAISAVVEHAGWTLETVAVGLAGVILVFGMWWAYFTMPSAEILSRFRDRSFAWGYGHILMFASIAATGAGLHVAAYLIEGEAHVSETFALLAVAIPVLVFVVTLFALYTALVRTFDPFHLGLFAGSVGLLALSVVLVASGATIGTALLVAALSPLVIVVGFELLGYRHQAEILQRL